VRLVRGLVVRCSMTISAPSLGSPSPLFHGAARGTFSGAVSEFDSAIAFTIVCQSLLQRVQSVRYQQYSGWHTPPLTRLVPLASQHPTNFRTGDGTHRC